MLTNWKPKANIANEISILVKINVLSSKTNRNNEENDHNTACVYWSATNLKKF
jgi:hypothetical protein